MANFGKRIDGPTGRRGVLRDEVVLAGSALSLKSSRPVVVTDVSPEGAKLQGRELASLDPNVMVHVGNVDLFATIAWTLGDECGVTFEERLAPEMVEHIKQEGRWAKVMGMAA